MQPLLYLFGQAHRFFLEEVTPFHQVKIASPPTILFYGGQDPLTPITQGTGLYDKPEDSAVTHQFTYTKMQATDGLF